MKENRKTWDVLITGAAGFIGNNLAYELLRQGKSILCIDNFNEYYDPNLKLLRKERLIKLEGENVNSNLHFKRLDLRYKKDVFSFFEEYKFETVCHLAAQAGVRYSIEYPQTYIDNNITATINLLEACKEYNVKDFVFSSTSSVYGLNTDMPFDEQTAIDSTISTYSSSKRACELLCHTYNKLYDIKFRILRFFTVYGPWGRPDMALFLFTKAIINGSPINLFNEGRMKRDFTYIGDIVSGFISAIENKFSFEIINLGSGECIKLEDYVSALEEKLGINAEKVMLPMQPGDVEETWADISKAKKLLNYNPRVQIKEGISNFVDWYNKNYT